MTTETKPWITICVPNYITHIIKRASTNNRGNELNKQRGFRVIKGRLIEVEI